MSSLTPYKLIQPTSVEPPTGFVSSDRIVFVIKQNQGQAIRKGTVRLNGLLELYRNGDDGETEITPADKLYLNPNAGINGFFKQITTNINGSRPIENLIEFGRLVALRNEVKYHQMSHGVSVDAMNELMAFSNDAYAQGAGNDSKVFSNMVFPVTAGKSQNPFSVDLDICINNSNVDISFTKTGDIEIAIILQEINKCGMLAQGGISGATYGYRIRNLELRYMTVPDVNPKAQLLMEVKSNPASPTVYNSRFSNLQITPVSSFHSLFCGLHNSTHNSTLALDYDYLASEAFPVQIDYLEIKVNGANGEIVQFPLRLQTAEILTNFIKAVNPEGPAHGLTYAKLSNALKTGYGVGVHLGEELQAGTNVSFNINFKDVLGASFVSNWFAVGTIEL